MSVVPHEQQTDPVTDLVSRVRTPQFRQEVALVLPENVPASRFVRATVTALLQNPEIATAQRESVFNAALRAAQDGLLPDGREAALVIYNTKVKDGGQERWVKKAQYLPMIGGLRKIAAEYGWTISAHVVYANDEFEHTMGMSESLLHRPVRPGQERGNPIAAYAVATHRDGRKVPAVMYAEDIEKVRQASRSKDSGPWRDWPERMWEKSAAKLLFKRLALDPGDRRVASVLNVDELEPGQAERMLYGPGVPAQLPAPREPIEGEIVDGRVHTDTPAEEPGDAPTQEAGGGQQAEGDPTAAEPTSTTNGPDGAPAPDDPEPHIGDTTPKAPTVAQARKVVLGWGVNKGKTLGEAAAADGATTYFVWAARNISRFEPDVAAALVVVMKHDVPDAYAVWEERAGRASS